MRIGKRLLPLLLLLALLLTACGAGEPAAVESTPEVTEEPAPQSTETPEAPEETPEELPEGAVAVSTVDELLSAIAPNTTIVLRAGDYDLSTAADYGQEELRGYYSWLLVPGGCTLCIRNVDGLQLLGQGEVSILARPRYAEVLSFTGCADLRLEGLTLGHTQEPGACAGGVLNCGACENVNVENCHLYGCGSVGLTSSDCRGLILQGCRIDGCSSGAVLAYGSRDLRLVDCQLCDNGQGKESSGYELIAADRCRDLALVNCEISGNRVQRILRSSWCERTSLLGCKLEGNRILDAVFQFQGKSAVVDRCSFTLRSQERYYPAGSSAFARNAEGEELISFDLDHMEWGEAEYAGPPAEDARPQRTELPEGGSEVHAATVDELLAAIAPDTTIYLEPGTYTLSEAADYGSGGSDWYTWEEDFDGYSLTIQQVENLCIVGAGKDDTLLLAEPRYASVLRFRECEGIVLSGFTAGHSEAPGYCTGNVLDLYTCTTVTVEDCGLFGCGVIGVYAVNCMDLHLRETEIYECSFAGADLSTCVDVYFEGCSIHDCDEGRNYIFLRGGDCSWDGEPLRVGCTLFEGGSCLGPVEPVW